MKACFHAYVRGKVQGVYFRKYTEEQAKLLGLTGWVRNIEDRVEVFACGEKENLDQLAEWLWEGSPAASVVDVTCEEMAWQLHESFEIV